MTKDELGYIPFFETGRDKLGLKNFLVGRVTAEFKESYKVASFEAEYLAKITGRQMFVASSREDYPAVGDWVAITELDDEHATINGILPRLTVIKRKYGDKTQIIATNIDIAFVVESVDRDYNLNRFERYFAIAESGGVKPAIILNKVDLLSKEECAEKLAELKKRFSGVDIIFTSIVNDEGLGDLKKYIAKGKTYCFLGSSGVGKSSLINKLIGESIIKTGDISSSSKRGKHVTTGRQMYFLQNGGIVIDNPGMREVGMAGTSQGIDSLFDEIATLSQECQYADCTHTHEPNCAVARAVKAGKLDEEKYLNYVTLKKEAEYYEMDEVGKREKDRKFGKFKKNVLKDLKEFR